MTKTTSAVCIWLGLLTAILAETLVYYQSPGSYLAEAVIGLLAAASTVAAALVSMDLKDESQALRYMLLVPVGLIAVLTITMLFAYPVSF